MKDLDLDRQLGFNLYRVAMLFKREHARALREYRLTPEQWQALATLWRTGPMRQVDIARVTLQDAPTVSRMLMRMERSGWVRNEPDPSDARSKVVRLTPEGARLREILPPKLIGHFNRYLRNFSESRQQQLLQLLQQLREATGDL
jgi:DNA-binding MarR family transcriptional regulator